MAITTIAAIDIAPNLGGKVLKIDVTTDDAGDIIDMADYGMVAVSVVMTVASGLVVADAVTVADALVAVTAAGTYELVVIGA